MYNYSPIKTLRVRNFRNLGSVDIDFTDSPIVTLVGENEAGKTSLIKAFSMCALHDSPREQKDYIRDGTNALGIEICLEDNTEVFRYKEANGANMYRVTKPDGTVWTSQKITDGLPKEVQDIIGLITEPETGEYLHVRTYEDRLLFVVTPSSTNYKVMYNALKVEQLTRAIKIGSTEANSLKAEITRNDNSLQTLYEQLRGVNIVDIEPLVEIKNRLAKQLEHLDKVARAQSLIERLKELQRQLGALALIDIYKLETISESVAGGLNNANRLVNNLAIKVNYRDKVSDVDSLGEIDLSNLTKAQSIASKITRLNEIAGNAGRFGEVANLEEVSEVIAVQVNKYRAMRDSVTALNASKIAVDVDDCTEITDEQLNMLSKAQRVCNQVLSVTAKMNEVAQYTTYIGQVEAYLKQCGVAVETCPKCGEDVIFDIDKV